MTGSLLIPVEYAGTDLTAANTNFMAYAFPTTGPSLVPARFEQMLVPVAGGWPRHSRSQPQAKILAFEIELLGDVTQDAIDELLTTFDPEQGEQSLILSDGTIEWEYLASVTGIEHDDVQRWWTVTLQASFGYARTRYASQATATIAATTATVPVVNRGNRKTPVVLTATPTVAKGQANDHIYRTQVPSAWRAAQPGIDHTIFVQLDTATEVAAGRMLASGNDLRVFVDGVQVQRDLGGMDALVTNVAFAANWSPACAVTLGTAMTDVSPATGADWDTGGDTSRLPGSNAVLFFGDEAIHYTSKASDGRTLLGITRAVRGTTAVAHAIGATAYWCEHQIDLIWGHSGASAPTLDANRTPIMDLAPEDSDNDRWTYSEAFATRDGLRPGEWRPLLLFTNTRALAMRGGYTSTDYYPLADNGTYNDGVAVGVADRWDAVDDEGKYFALLAVAAAKQSFVSAPVARASETVASVAVTIRAREESFATNQLRAFLRIGGVNYYATAWDDSASEDTTTEYVTKTATWLLNPATAAAWLNAAVVSVEWGVESTLGASVIRVSQASVTIAYNPSTPANYLPTSDNGYHLNGTKSGGSTFWPLLDDPVGADDGDTTRVTTTNSNDSKLTFVRTPTVPAYGIHAIALTVTGRVKNPGGANRKWNGMLRRNSIDYLIATDNLYLATGSYVTRSATWASDPSGGAWTAADLAAGIEFGYASKYGSNDSDGVRVTQVYLTVQYTPDDQQVLPAADTGTYNDGVAHGAATRWQTVDGTPGVPNDDTAYLTLAATPDLRQTFVNTLPALPAGSIEAVVLSVRAREDTSGTSDLDPIVVINGVVYDDAWATGSSNLTTAYADNLAVFANNPATGSPWTPADLVTLEWGVESNSGVIVRVTSMSLRIRLISDDDTALEMGLYVGPSAPYAGKLNRDTWALVTPVGVVGQNAIIAELVAGLTLTGTGARIYTVDSLGQTVARTTLPNAQAVNMSVPAFQVQIRLVTNAETTFEGFAITSIILRFDPEHTPLMLVGARESVYVHRWTLVNPSHPDDQEIEFVWPSALNETVTIDSETGQVTYSLPGSNPLPALALDAARKDWLELVAGYNGLAFSDPSHGSGSLSLAVAHRDRKA